MQKFGLIILLIFLVLNNSKCASILINTYSNEYVKRIRNPERGWVNTRAENFYDVNDEMGTIDETLVYKNFIFGNEKDRPLSQNTLDYVKRCLSKVRENRKKIVLGFAYTETDNKDAPMNIIETHIKQLSPILHDFQDIILVMNGGFIGTWGEWNDSSNGLGTEQGRRTLMGLLLKYVPKSFYLSMRYPLDKMKFYGQTPLSASEGISFATDNSKIGWHNACFLFDSHDRGTFFSYIDSIPQSAIENFAKEESNYVPVGGELCIFENNPASRFNCLNGKRELALYHYTYMNYHTTASKVESTFPWVQEGCYDEITDRYGYQLFLRESYVSHSIYNLGSKENFSYRFKIENKGYAAPLKNRNVELVFLSSTTRIVIPLNNVPNLKSWAPDKIIEISGIIPSSSFPQHMAGQIFSVNLRLPDPSPKLKDISEYSIGFVNIGIFDPITGLNDLKIGIPFGNSVYTPPNFVELGCYKDSYERDLPHFWGTNFEKSSCFQKANSVGHKFFALQYFGECYSGNSNRKYEKLDNSKCDTKCNVDRSQNCGGGYANFVFSVFPTPTPALEELGCYQDNGIRDFEKSWGTNYERNTCFQKANSVGHKFFGLQYNGECFSGNSNRKYGKVDMSKCDTKCTADPSQNCGGFFTNIVYQTNNWGPVHFAELGCFGDNYSNRDLEKSWGKSFEKNTCYKKALSVGHKYFGLQYTGECYSGNTYGKYKREDMSKCNTKCSVDPTQNCGGAFVNLVFEIKRNLLEVNDGDDVLNY